MAVELPVWVEYAKVFWTPMLALIAGGIASLIAYQQWRTAHQKVVLELFQRRIEAYNLIFEAMTGVNQSSGGDDVRLHIRTLARGINQAKFVFGVEVNEYLDDLWLTTLRLRSVTFRLPTADDCMVDDMVARQDACWDRISAFYADFDRLVIPYMRMDQKLRRSKR